MALGETLPGISERISLCAGRTVKNLHNRDLSNVCVVLMCKGARDTTARRGNVAGREMLGWLGYEEGTVCHG